MIIRIMEAICAALDAEFGEECPSYIEETEQGLAGPCFFVQCLRTSSELVAGGRHQRRDRFCVRYYPPPGSVNRECCLAAERLNDCLECITVEGLIRGSQMYGEIAGGVLNYFVNYEYIVQKQEEAEAMDQIASYCAVKGGD